LKELLAHILRKRGDLGAEERCEAAQRDQGVEAIRKGDGVISVDQKGETKEGVSGKDLEFPRVVGIDLFIEAVFSD